MQCSGDSKIGRETQRKGWWADDGEERAQGKEEEVDGTLEVEMG